MGGRCILLGGPEGISMRAANGNERGYSMACNGYK